MDASQADPLAKPEHEGTPVFFRGKLFGACFLGYVFCTNKKGNAPRQGRKQMLKLGKER